MGKENEVLRAIEEILEKHFSSLEYGNINMMDVKAKLELSLDLIQDRRIGPKLNPFLREAIEDAGQLFEIDLRKEA